jgi:hypothetical protein
VPSGRTDLAKSLARQLRYAARFDTAFLVLIRKFRDISLSVDVLSRRRASRSCINT